MQLKNEVKPTDKIEVDGVEIYRWMITNLRYYGDTQVPFPFIIRFGTEQMEKVLGKAVKAKVYIHVARARKQDEAQAIATIRYKTRQNRAKTR